VFFSKSMEFKREVAVNLLVGKSYGRDQFLGERYSLGRSEIWEIRDRLIESLEPRPSGRPRQPQVAHSTGPCAACQEKEDRIATILAEHSAERERGCRGLTIQAAVLPNSAESIVLLQKAAFGV